MQLLLLESIDGIGDKHQLVTVDDDLALKTILPQRKGLVATPTVRKRFAEQIAKHSLLTNEQ